MTSYTDGFGPVPCVPIISPKREISTQAGRRATEDKTTQALENLPTRERPKEQIQNTAYSAILKLSQRFPEISSLLHQLGSEEQQANQELTDALMEKVNKRIKDRTIGPTELDLIMSIMLTKAKAFKNTAQDIPQKELKDIELLEARISLEKQRLNDLNEFFNWMLSYIDMETGELVKPGSSNLQQDWEQLDKSRIALAEKENEQIKKKNKQKRSEAPQWNRIVAMSHSFESKELEKMLQISMQKITMQEVRKNKTK